MSRPEYFKEYQKKNRARLNEYTRIYLIGWRKRTNYWLKRKISVQSRPDALKKQKAREKARSAVRNGKLIKLPCEVCGDIKSQAHHPDYDKPLEVIWLCQSDHVKTHRELKENYASKKNDITDNLGRSLL